MYNEASLNALLNREGSEENNSMNVSPRSSDSVSLGLNTYHDIIKAPAVDPLTGLCSKEQFFLLAKDFDRKHPLEGVDAIVLNYNKFHLINELYGRKFGDKVLCAIADCVSETAKEHGGIACRYDADKFYMYIKHQKSYEFLIHQVSDKLAHMMKTPDIRVRIGIYPDLFKDATIEQRFDRAMQACNSITKGHATCYEIYDSKMHEKEMFEARLLDSIGSAFAENQFSLAFQPKYNVHGNLPKLTSAEVLIRWKHPEFGLVKPDFFIPLFEENGLIRQLDRYVWRKAAAQIRRWKDELGYSIPVSVNVSRVDIFDPDIIDYLKQLIKDYDIETGDLHLEITETAYTDNVEQIVSVVKELQREGFMVEMDDFGKGYSSINMLTNLPLDALKLDIGFIKDITENNKGKNLLGCILEIAKLLNLTVIAEGVENSKQYFLLKNAGCDEIQGFYFSKPLASTEFRNLLASEA
ncbi:GGDEF domain-containing protein [Butyrivibrio sp. X503]|nr:GGDEF domain-containing protein [Butyrivibrio sp. X503]